MAEHNHPLTARLILSLLKGAAKHSLDAEGVEEISGYAIAQDLFGLRCARQINKSLGITDKLLEALTVCLPIGEDAGHDVLVVPTLLWVL